VPRIFQYPKKNRDAGRVYKTSDKRENLNTIAVYNTDTWRKLRLEYIKEHTFCETCLASGKYTLAQEVHHKIPISEGSSIADKQFLGFDWNNLKAVCKPCHKLENLQLTFAV